jgi:ectoine hydroxylase-related dioxygenase (phytanoyl-CoA dioxygenase family)
MVDGSHRWKEIGANDTVVRHFAERDKSELDQMLAENAEFNGVEVVKLPITIPRGHLNFHHCKTYHGSGANVSDRPRRAISLHLQDGDNAFREFRLSNGELAGYNHDSLVRRTADGRPDYSDPEYCPVLWRE